VVLIGLGAIGAGYDFDDPSKVLTHARAVLQSTDFILVAAVDPSAQQRTRFERQYTVPTFATITGCAQLIAGAVVILATPDDTHAAVTHEVLAQSPPIALLCEKPVGTGIEQAIAIQEACEAAGVPLWVNYIRRTDPGFIDAQQRLAESCATGPSSPVVDLRISGDLRHVGCHFIDLMLHWFGPVQAAYPRTGGVDLVLKTARVHIETLGTDNRVDFGIEITCNSARLRYEEPDSLFHWEVNDQESLSAVTIGTELHHYQANVLNDLKHALNGEPTHLATGLDAVHVHRAIDLILECS
jgi:predicted dehydrogenase